LKKINLEGLPKRPKGTTRIAAQISFASDSEASAEFRDIGFGEIEPASGYEETFVTTIY
jgi:hypothetical protein